MANRYWVGGTGTWDATNVLNWSLTSGGVGGAPVPTAADTALFDSLSGTGTCTTASGAVCSAMTINSSTCAVTLGANLTMSGICTLTSGTLSLGSYTLTAFRLINDGTGTRTTDFGTGKIEITGNNATIINWQGSNHTVLGTKNIYCTYSGSTGTRTISTSATGTTESNVFNLYVTAGTDTVGSFSRIGTVNFTGFKGTYNSAATKIIYGSFTFDSGMTITGSANNHQFGGTSGPYTITTAGLTLDFPVTFDGVGGTWQLQDNCTVGSTRTVTLTNGTLDLNSKTLNCGVFSSSNSNTRTIAYGTGNITVTGSGAIVYNLATTTGLTITGTPVVNLTYAGSTGTRTVYNGINAKTVNINVLAGSDTVTFNNTFYYTNVDFTGFNGTWTSSSIGEIYGNLTISSGMTVGELGTSAKLISFLGTGITQTITTSGKTFDCNLTFDGVGTTFTFADALTQGSTRAFTITNGTVKLKSGATSTVGAFATSGSNQKYLQSTTAGSQATLSQASGTVTVSYLSIKDIAATGGATWNAYVDYNNVDRGDNTGWDFSYSPAIDNEFPIALRSFTQPKRF